MVLCSLMLLSSLAIKLSTPTSLGNPFTMLMVGLLLSGKPVPLQETDPEGETVQPEIVWLALLMGTPLAIRSAIASGMLPPQSPCTVMQVGDAGVGRCTMVGLVTPPKEFPTS